MQTDQPEDGQAGDADGTLRRTLRDVLVSGASLGGGGGRSRELLDYQVTLADPRARVVTDPVRPLDTIGAVARFVWMAAGNDRLADIAFYEPKVKGYTDDGLVVPGSSYGRRLRQPSPGTDQLSGVVERLRKDPDSRQAAAVIWSPEDAVRTSADIPCAFGVFYRVRGGRLLATTVMRSNNAFRLLPFNVFEFTMLAELVAAELDVPMGRYTHWAASMHVLDVEEVPARALAEGPGSVSLVMPAMPCADSPLAAVRALAVAEAELRHATGPDAVLALRDGFARSCHAYWAALFDVLVVHALRVHRADADAETVRRALPPYLAAGVKDAPTSAVPVPDRHEQLSLVDVAASEGLAAAVESALRPGPAEAEAELDAAVARYEAETGDEVTRREFAALVRAAGAGGYALAARSDGPDASAADRMPTPAEIAGRLDEIRRA